MFKFAVYENIMASQTKENYLKALYFLDKEQPQISVSDLGKAMEVSSPTVNSMVKQLEKNGWVEYKKYKPLRLTAKGRKEAALIIRKHRIAEMYLVEKMHFGWEEVHDIAEEMEHITSEELFDRMDHLLGYPKFDPHGSPIPDKKGSVIDHNYIPLNKVEEGTHVLLKALRYSPKELLEYLNQKQIELGTSMVIKRIEPFDNSYLVQYDDKIESLSQKVCEQLLVEQQNS